MEALIREMMRQMHAKIEAEMPEEGDFEAIKSDNFDTPNPKLVVRQFWLEASPAPKGVENYEVVRGVFCYASKGEASVNILIATGTKRTLLERLESEELIQKLFKQTDNLSYNLIDL